MSFTPLTGTTATALSSIPVRNLTAARGRAVLQHGRVESVHLEKVEPAARAPILRRYLQVAPGARPHIPVDRKARWLSSHRSPRITRSSASPDPA